MPIEPKYLGGVSLQFFKKCLSYKQISHMQVLNEAEFHRKAEPILRQIFINDDPFGQSFAPDVPARRIIYEYFYQIEPPLLDAVVAVASMLGDTGCYLSSLWRVSEEVTDKPPYHWYIPFSEISVYKEGSSKLKFVLSSENVLYSPQGKWGIMTSHEHHGLLGGTLEFVEEIHRRVPNFDEQIYGFLKYWKYWNERGTKVNWLPELLAHIYGQKQLQSYY